MRLWVFSDLHLIFAGVSTPLHVPSADVCVVAGDIHVKGPERSVRWLIEHVCPHMPVVFVSGNHEFYHEAFIEGLEDGRAAASSQSNFHFLENDEVEIDGVRFAGSTLWSDFELMGHRPFAMHYAESRMSDYDEVRFTKRSSRRLRAVHTVRAHRDSRRFIEDFLERNRNGKSVVVTHHAPSRKSVADVYATDILSGAFASDLDALIVDRGPSLWIHGHVHQRYDYKIGGTRVLCNPRGYPDEASFAVFDFSLVVEV